MAVVDANGLPIGLRVLTAGEHEVKQAQDTILECWTVELPQRTVADRAFDSDADGFALALDTSLAELGVEVIAPHRKTASPKTRPRTDASYLATSVGGKWSGSSRGWATSVAC